MSDLIASWFKQQFAGLCPGREHKANGLPGVPRHVKHKTVTLVEAAPALESNTPGVQWFGFLMQDERGLMLNHAEAERLNLRIFSVTGLDGQADTLQHSAFDPGRILKVGEAANDQRVGIWDSSGVVMGGFVPRSHNEFVREAMELPGHAGIALGEYRKNGKRIGLTVMFGAMEIKA
jgi:hypothetical protein